MWWGSADTHPNTGHPYTHTACAHTDPDPASTYSNTNTATDNTYTDASAGDNTYTDANPNALGGSNPHSADRQLHALDQSGVCECSAHRRNRHLYGDDNADRWIQCAS